MSCVCPTVRRIDYSSVETVPSSCCDIRVRRPAPPVPVTYEPETEGYLQHADVNILNDSTVYFGSTIWEITGAEIWTALDAFVVQVKTALGLALGSLTLQTRSKFYLPRIGNSAGAFAVDLCTATTIGTWFGGFTYSPSGALPNGVNGYFELNIPYNSTYFANNNQAFLFRSRTNSDGLYADFGRGGNGFSDVFIRCRRSNLFDSIINDQTNDTTANTSSVGVFSISRSLSTGYKKFIDGAVVDTVTQTSTSMAVSPAGGNIVEFALNNASSIIQYSDREHDDFASFDALSDTEMADIYTAIDQLNTTLNR